MLESNKIYQGDCLELIKQIPDGSVDFLFTDPPYNTTKAKFERVIDWNVLWPEYERVIKPNGAIAIFAQSPFDKTLAVSNLKLFRYEWIWEKSHATGYLNAKKMPMKCHEQILIFYKKMPTYNPQKTTGHVRKQSKAIHKHKTKNNQTELYGEHSEFVDYDSTERYPRDVLKFPSDKQKIAVHPTQKPVELLKYFINTYSNENDLILDTFSGSGSTAIAAIQTNRKYLCFELDQEYVDISNNRILELTNEK